MAHLKKRLRALEKRSGLQSPVWLVNWTGLSQTQLIANWEAENGPVGSREINFINVEWIKS